MRQTTTYFDMLLFKRLYTSAVIPSSIRFASSSSGAAMAGINSQRPQIIKRFAPLNPDIKADSNASTIEGIVFDVDGTLW